MIYPVEYRLSRHFIELNLFCIVISPIFGLSKSVCKVILPYSFSSSFSFLSMFDFLVIWLHSLLKYAEVYE